jgi:nucleotide-binding universal stress UspA family protein
MSERIATILVPVDFSPHADRAYRYATMLAQRLGATLELVHVVEDPFVTAGWNAEVYVPTAGELLEGLLANAEQRLATLKTSAAALGLVARAVVIVGRPAHAIVERAQQSRCDLIVMGTHGRRGLSHIVMGSVAEHVVRAAPCPVLTVRAMQDGAARQPSAAA